MKNFREFITEEISKETQEYTKLLVDEVYSRYIDDHDKNSIECVGWLDGTENAQLRFQKIYEAGIGNNDSILDVGCGVAHLHTFLSNQGWSGKYLGFDPNKKAIDLVDESINVMEGTIEDLGELAEWNRFDWVIANGVFNLGLKEEHTFWIIENMISHANKGIVFNMLQKPYPDSQYEAYYPERIKEKLSRFDHSKIEIIEDYMPGDAEFTVYFYKT
jgi:SAM-dependent methyltransferase